MKHNLKNKILLVKEAAFGRNWDWTSLQMLEYRKICEMLNCCKEKASIYADSQYTIRELSICKKLLEIILEIDINEDEIFTKSEKLNLRNINRFFPSSVAASYESIIARDKESLRKWVLIDFYQEKARHLYHKIRFLKEQSWWF